MALVALAVLVVVALVIAVGVHTGPHGLVAAGTLGIAASIGFVIGIIYVFGGQLAGGEWSDSLIFAILVIILTFRPTGLFGVDVTTRA